MDVTLKLATSLDGRIATASGESRWITGPQARAAGHGLRAEHDAVLVGIGTALADDPQLTVRLDGFLGRQPARVVLDSRQRLPLSAKLVTTARDIPTYVVAVGAPSAALVEAGVRVLTVQAGDDGRPDLRATLRALADEGLGRIFVEGGGEAAGGFLRRGLADRIEWFRAPILLGGDGRACVGVLAMSGLAAAPRFHRTEVREIGGDLWERYKRT